ncbi:MAG TPA: diguanylate cyclase [Terriglobales bacterium]|nr:diguanylate cyclase [Terriglobales bacterium]
MKTLIAEDSGFYQKLLSRYLRDWGLEAVVTKSGAEAWSVLSATDGPRLALIDWVLPDIDGLELCRRIRSGDLGERYVYTVLLTSNNESHHVLEGLKAGADDFLGKPFAPAELEARLFTGKRIVEVHAELIQTRERLNYAATHDSLTGLCNRGEILNLLHRELLRGARDHQPTGVILADIDHFKRINDAHGHSAGDQVLKRVAQRLRAGLRAYDGVGRYGGEEFLIVLPGCDAAQTLRRADELRHSICALPATGQVHVSISMGVCSSEHLGSDPDFLLKNADDALYRAKDLGRNRVHPVTVFHPVAMASSTEMRSFV